MGIFASEHNPTVYSGDSEMEYYEKYKDREEREAREQKAAADYKEWLDANDMHGICRRCQWIREIYGKYRDPDDEWRAIDEICNKCTKEVMK